VLADICARLRNVAGDHHQAIEVGRRAAAIAADIGDRELEREAHYRTGQAHFAIGDYRRAVDLLSRCTEAGRRDAPASPLFTSWSHAWLALALSTLGRFGEAMTHAQESLRIAEAANHPFSVAEAATSVGTVWLTQGELDLAVQSLERARALILEWNLRSSAALARLGYACVLRGRAAEARALLEDVARQSTAMSSLGVGRAMQMTWLGDACLLEGAMDRAREHAHEALALARRHRERGHEAWSLRLLGAIASAPDGRDAGAARRQYDDALALADELGMRPLAAQCHAELGRVLRTAGRGDEASGHLMAAATMCREIGMRFRAGGMEAETGDST
jgi:tetratricopeptide (TPR) repeat protein